MKKVLLALVCITAMATLKAQVQFGAKAGLNISNLAGADASGYKAKAGFHAGGFANVPLKDNFSIQPELLFSLQGAKVDQYGEDTKFNTTYLNIPVMAKYTHESGFFAETGPQLGFMISAKRKRGGYKDNIKEDLKTFDLAWGIGAGYLIQSNIGVNARFNLGITKVDVDGDARIHNNAFQVGVVYLFEK